MNKSWLDRAKQLINKHGVSHESIAEDLGCTRGAVSHYLNGRRKPSLLQIEKIAQSLNVEPCWLMFGKGCNSIGETLKPRFSVATIPEKLLNNQQSNHHPFLKMDDLNRKIYGLSVHGEQWKPRFQHKEVIIIHPEAALESGAEVWVNFHNGNSDILTLLETGAEHMVFDSLDPSGQMQRIPLGQIMSVEVIIAVVKGEVFPLLFQPYLLVE